MPATSKEALDRKRLKRRLERRAERAAERAQKGLAVKVRVVFDRVEAERAQAEEFRYEPRECRVALRRRR